MMSERHNRMQTQIFSPSSSAPSRTAVSSVALRPPLEERVTRRPSKEVTGRTEWWRGERHVATAIIDCTVKGHIESVYLITCDDAKFVADLGLAREIAEVQ